MNNSLIDTISHFWLKEQISIKKIRNFIYLSIAYIHRYCTGPPSFASVTRWQVKWTMIVKNVGGNNISKWLIVWTYRDRSLSRSERLKFLAHSCRKNELNSISTAVTLSGKTLRIEIGNKWCMRMWKSWLFIPKIFRCFKSIHLEMLLAYPSGILTFFKVRKNTSFLKPFFWYSK